MNNDDEDSDFGDGSFDDDLGSDRGVGANLGAALNDNQFKSKNIFSDKYKD